MMTKLHNEFKKNGNYGKIDYIFCDNNDNTGEFPDCLQQKVDIVWFAGCNLICQIISSNDTIKKMFDYLNENGIFLFTEGENYYKKVYKNISETLTLPIDIIMNNPHDFYYMDKDTKKETKKEIIEQINDLFIKIDENDLIYYKKKKLISDKINMNYLNLFEELGIPYTQSIQYQMVGNIEKKLKKLNKEIIKEIDNCYESKLNILTKINMVMLFFNKKVIYIEFDSLLKSREILSDEMSSPYCSLFLIIYLKDNNINNLKKISEFILNFNEMNLTGNLSTTKHIDFLVIKNKDKKKYEVLNKLQSSQLSVDIKKLWNTLGISDTQSNQEKIVRDIEKKLDKKIIKEIDECYESKLNISKNISVFKNFYDINIVHFNFVDFISNLNTELTKYIKVEDEFIRFFLIININDTDKDKEDKIVCSLISSTIIEYNEINKNDILSKSKEIVNFMLIKSSSSKEFNEISKLSELSDMDEISKLSELSEYKEITDLNDEFKNNKLFEIFIRGDGFCSLWSVMLGYIIENDKYFKYRGNNIYDIDKFRKELVKFIADKKKDLLYISNTIDGKSNTGKNFDDLIEQINNDDINMISSDVLLQYVIPEFLNLEIILYKIESGNYFKIKYKKYIKDKNTKTIYLLNNDFHYSLLISRDYYYNYTIIKGEDKEFNTIINLHNSKLQNIQKKSGDMSEQDLYFQITDSNIKKDQNIENLEKQLFDEGNNSEKWYSKAKNNIKTNLPEPAINFRMSMLDSKFKLEETTFNFQNKYYYRRHLECEKDKCIFNK
jgi:hypothetical protein